MTSAPVHTRHMPAILGSSREPLVQAPPACCDASVTRTPPLNLVTSVQPEAGVPESGP